MKNGTTHTELQWMLEVKEKEEIRNSRSEMRAEVSLFFSFLLV